jgi:hypothetical protein
MRIISEMCRNSIVCLLTLGIFFCGCSSLIPYRKVLRGDQGFFVFISKGDTVDLGTRNAQSLSCEPASRILLSLKGKWTGFLGISYGNADLGSPHFIVEERLDGKDYYYEFLLSKLACSWEGTKQKEGCNPPDYLGVTFIIRENQLRRKLTKSVKLDFSQWDHQCYCEDNED